MLWYKIFHEFLDNNPEYAYIGKVIKCTTKSSVGSNKLILIQVYSWYHCWWREETQTSGFVFPRTDSSDSALYFNMKNKTINPEKFLKHVWGIFFHNYYLFIALEKCMYRSYSSVTCYYLLNLFQRLYCHSAFPLKEKQTNSEPAVLLSNT